MTKIEELDQATGTSKRFYYNPPEIRFNGKTGEYFVIRNKQKELLGTSVEVIFVNRGRFKLANQTIFSEFVDFPAKATNINVYEYDTEKKKTSLRAQGSWNEMKGQFQLKTYQYAYAVLGKEILSVRILPGSLGNFWDFLDSFDGEDRFYLHSCVLSSAIKKGKLASYNEMTFTKGKAYVEADQIAPFIFEVKTNLDKEKSAIKKFEKEAITNDDKNLDDIPVIQEDDTPIEDIPL